MSTNTRNSNVRSNILGTTGLSRAVLADYFRSRGLFGSDSQLGLAEQAVVQSRLPAIAGIARLPVTALETPRLVALADYVEALVAGRNRVAESARRRLIAAGLSASAVLEAEVTVDNVRVLFSPLPATSATAPLASETRAQPQYARAA